MSAASLTLVDLPALGVPDRRALYEHLRQRVTIHTASAVRRNKRYKRMASLLHVSIPLTSLVLTLLATADFEHQHEVTAAVAIALTVLTGANSALEPSRRYHAYAEICISLHDRMFELESGVERLKGGPEEELIELLRHVNREISVIGEKMATLPVVRERLG